MDSRSYFCGVEARYILYVLTSNRALILVCNIPELYCVALVFQWGRHVSCMDQVWCVLCIPRRTQTETVFSPTSHRIRNIFCSYTKAQNMVSSCRSFASLCGPILQALPSRLGLCSRSFRWTQFLDLQERAQQVRTRRIGVFQSSPQDGKCHVEVMQPTP